MKDCPKCKEEMVIIKTGDGHYYYCNKCSEIIIVK